MSKLIYNPIEDPEAENPIADPYHSLTIKLTNHE